MARRSWNESAAVRARIRGCLLGGAIGDALGNPVEFLSTARIRETYGPEGLRDLVAAGREPAGTVTDDTQMTLFTAEGLIRAHARASAKGIGGAETQLVMEAYLRWLDTQNHPAPPPADGQPYRDGRLREEPWLYARRAPGNACLTGLEQRHIPDPHAELRGEPGPVNPGSKGCGTVMRSAPFGLTGADARQAFELAARCAQITHGHPTGYYAAGAFAAVVHHLLYGETPEAAVLRTLRLLARYPGHEETTSALTRAVDLAAACDGTALPDPERVEMLGGGWVAEEALAIAVFCLLAGHASAPREANGPLSARRTRIRDTLLLSVNHSGDSDSTGAVCGNLLGAHHGDFRLPREWLSRVEGRAVIALLADDFDAEFHPADERAPQW
ncbi:MULTISPECIES: ADP-ribosylglycohydrolase family protein [Streptomyces]|uniref:ADP-ribosylglycohydrolase family protein n=1 Tax=Streptomyces lycii TaxID=2654337 RepID=A0ABQ7FEH3_9ACTN|nr:MULTISPECIES: ADP-ribosylglycohydrolase family protein [Streptomyces]KAF4407262.1 ADP-ribosylglycohydrolase family protein [Streptomyces lycii]PGH50917.1 ADP-ribosylglycohydrolase [Streptomyces sp. Ru87]